MNQNEQPLPVQQDTLTQLPGGGIRTIVATVLVNGVPTPVQMQVTNLADGLGNVIDDFADYNWKKEMIFELREIRRLLGAQQGAFVPIADSQSNTQDSSRY